MKTASDISLLDCQGLLHQALLPNSVFDRPTAITELQQALRQIQALQTRVQEYQIQEQEHQLQAKLANEQNDELQQELLQLEADKLQIEQEMLEMVEQRKHIRQENDLLKENVTYQMELNSSLKQQLDEANERLQEEGRCEGKLAAYEDQVEFLQQALAERKRAEEGLEKQNELLLSRDLEIHNTITRIKQRYRQKLLKKQQELEEIKLHFAEFQQQFNLKMEEMNQQQALQHDHGQRWTFQANSCCNPVGYDNESRAVHGSFGHPPLAMSKADDHLDRQSRHLLDDQQTLGLSETQTKQNSQSNTYPAGLKYELQTKQSQKSAREQESSARLAKSRELTGRQSSYAKSDRRDLVDQRGLAAAGALVHALDDVKAAEQDSLAPNVSDQLEKLRSFISETVQTLLKNQQEQLSQLHAKEQAQASQPLRPQQANEPIQDLTKAVQGLESLIGSQNAQLKDAAHQQEAKIRHLQVQNDQLAVDNTRLRQASNQYQSEIVQLQARQTESEYLALREERDKARLLKERNNQLEEQILNLGRRSYRDQDVATKNLEVLRRSLEELQMLAGFVLNRLGFRHREVPQDLALHMAGDLEVKPMSKTMKHLLESVDERLAALLEAQQKAEKLQPLKQENKELLKILHLEQKNRRQLQNKLQEERGNIRVICRVRPVQNTEKRQGWKASGFHYVGANKLQLESVLGHQQKTFTFDRVLQAGSKQAEIHEEVTSLIASALEGFNVCIMAYG